MARHTARSSRSRRIFLALWPQPAVRRRIAAHAAHWTFGDDARRYAPADWHVTLHFLGDVAIERVPAIVDGVAVPVEPCELLLDQPQRWPRGLAVVCASRMPEALLDLHTRLSHAVSRLGLNVEARPYRPHLTLARHAGDAAAPIASPPIVWPVHGYALVVSTGQADQRYTVLRRYR